MVRRIAALAVFDFFALAVLYFVLRDVAWRNSYAESEDLVPHTTYSLFIRMFSITGNSVQIPLVSPPALDWVQVVVALLIVFNGLYVFSSLRTSPTRSA